MVTELEVCLRFAKKLGWTDLKVVKDSFAVGKRPDGETDVVPALITLENQWHRDFLEKRLRMLEDELIPAYNELRDCLNDENDYNGMEVTGRHQFTYEQEATSILECLKRMDDGEDWKTAVEPWQKYIESVTGTTK